PAWTRRWRRHNAANTRRVLRCGAGLHGPRGASARRRATKEKAMFRRALLTSIAIIGVQVFISAQDAKSVIDASSKAMGVDALPTVEYSGSGFDFVYGQAYSPTSPWPKFADKTYTRQINFQTPASRMDRVRMQAENPPRGGGQQPVRGEQMQNQTVVVTPSTPWIQQLEIWMMPHAFLRAAAMNNATVKRRGGAGKAYRRGTFRGQKQAAVNG